MRKVRNRIGILFIIGELAPGGAEVVISRIAQKVQSDFRIFIMPLHPERNNEQFIQSVIKKQTACKILKKEPPQPSKLANWLFWKINAVAFQFGVQGVRRKILITRTKLYWYMLLKIHGIKVINSHSRESDYFATHTLKPITRTPVVITMHSDYNPDYWGSDQNKRQHFFEVSRSIFEKANRIVYIADRNTEVFHQLQNGTELFYKAVKQYNGFVKPKEFKNLRSFLNVSDASFMVSMIARGTEEKGWQEAIHAFLKFQNQHPNSDLILVCPITEYIESLREKYFKNRRIHFRGFVANPLDYFYSSDCSILPTYWPESLPNSITESLAAGCPVIATNVAEIPKMIESPNGNAGLIIPLDNNGKANVERLKEALLEIASEKAASSKFKNNTELAFSKFNMDNCSETYRHIFQELTK